LATLRVFVPSLNVMLPVAPEGVTAALSVTLCPTGAGFSEEESAVVVVAWFTVCVSADDTLAVYKAAPE
jgi:hypothetical protein